MHKLKIRQIGNSAGVILPKEALDDLQVSQGDVLILEKDSEGYRLLPFDADFNEAMDAYEEGRKAYRNTLRTLAK